MAEQPELWAFVLANMGMFLFGSLLTVLSYLAYRRSSGRSSYRFATVGFGFVVVGGLVEPAYQLGVGVDYTLNGTELLLLQAGEGVLLAIGLGLLFYAITRYDAGPSPPGEEYLTDEDRYWDDQSDVDWEG